MTTAAIEVRPDGVVPIRRRGSAPFKVLLFGGGALAGWGLLDHERGLPGRLADRLADRSGRGLDLDVVVETDPTRPEALAGLRGLRIARYDAVVVLLGERQGLEHVGRGTWSKEFAALAETLAGEAAEDASLLVLDSAQPMIAVSATGLKRRRASAGAGKLAEVAREVCAGSRIVFDELEAPASLLGWGRQFATADYREWGATIADRLLPLLRATDGGASAALRGLPQDEQLRQRAVDAMRLSQATRDSLLDGIVRQAKSVYRIQAAYLNIVDGDRVWSRASTRSALGEIPRAGAFCDRVVRRDGPTIIGDVRLDPGFGGEVPSLMGDPVRFYAGEPIHSMDGHRIGALCITDGTARTVQPAQLADLHVLAGAVEKELWAQTLLRR